MTSQVLSINSGALQVLMDESLSDHRYLQLNYDENIHCAPKIVLTRDVHRITSDVNFIAYADDLAVLMYGASLEKLEKSFENVMLKLENWRIGEGLEFNLEKLLQSFSRGLGSKNNNNKKLSINKIKNVTYCIFSFSFFPNVMQAPLIVIGNAVFECLVYIKICKKPHRKYNVASSSSVTLTIPGTEPHDAERRRQIALRALSERLSKVEQVSWLSAVDEVKSDKSKNVSITIPPILAHHQSSLSSNINSSKVETAHEEMEKATSDNHQQLSTQP
ncbi:uncharacterized protein LOC118194739 [Stegodyphus dumicola]|uniref:uncharacterized protein LOC118194739 n=1 Tax=Stegodyphus dumicola TaxID=202533 RepID=UPI0015A96A13|nr:uncharacterized protein LOC118194739 [Stegodyphus dumicola]